MKTYQETFAKFTRLGSRVAVYVPGTVGTADENTEAAEKMQEYVAGRLSDLFGGATVTDGRGYWISEQAGLVAEYVRIVYSNTTAEDLDRHAGEILELAEHVKREMDQEAVSVEVNGALYLI